MNPSFIRKQKLPAGGVRDPFWHRYRLTLCTAILIMIAVLLPGGTFTEIKVEVLGLDKIVHFLMFFVFSLSFSIEFRKDRKHMPRIIPLLLFLAGFSLFTEISQLFTEDRSFDLFDALADLTGAIIARLFADLIYRLYRQHVSPAFRKKIDRDPRQP